MVQANKWKRGLVRYMFPPVAPADDQKDAYLELLRTDDNDLSRGPA